MAETLVHLASFKEKFTPGADFVGGPIDVAVISRGDGIMLLTVFRKQRQTERVQLQRARRALASVAAAGWLAHEEG